jgi:hypothetical protein
MLLKYTLGQVNPIPMKKTLNSVLITSILLALASAACAQTTANLTYLADDGGFPIAPTPGADDQSQLTTGGHQKPGGLNYYLDNDPPPGQTFTTGSNSGGYILNSLSFFIADDAGGLPSGGQAYMLRIYTVSGSSATLYASYISPNNVILYPTYWYQWTNLNNLPLLPNTQYAFSVARAPGATGWANLGNVSGDLYSAGQVALIPTGGGTMQFSDAAADASFDVGLTATATLPVGVGSLAFSPGSNVTNGTPVTVSATVLGGGTLYYQWLTDGGSGGALTNIPGATGTTLSVNTTGVAPGVYNYGLIVTNSVSAATNFGNMTVIMTSSTANLQDAGASIIPAANDISQLTGGGTGDGMNYYDNNDPRPGQTFTTGTNPQGYLLTSVTVGTGNQSGGSEGHTSELKPYALQVYQVVGGNNAVLIASYTNSSFLFTFGDWLTWSGFSPVLLRPNTMYAYSFHLEPNVGGGWAAMSIAQGDPYAGGQAGLIPVGGGTIAFGNSGLSDAAFVVGIALVGYPGVTLPTFSPASPVYAGTPVTVSASVTGDGPFTYQWQTDGGSGTFTNIPGAINPTLTVNTVALGGLTVGYDLVVGNGVGPTTSAAAELTVLPPQAPTVVIDITNSLDQITSQVTTFVGGTVAFSDTQIQGTFPIIYQWQTDGGTATFTNIPAATNNILTLSNLTVSASGNYRLMATNSQGSAQTSAANLTVLPQPTNSFIVNFQYHTMVNADVGNYTGLGVIGTGTYWNQMIDPNSDYNHPGTYFTTSGALSDDGTTNRGMSWTIICNNSWGWTSTPTIALLDSAANAYIPSTFQFTLPKGIYNLVLFSCNGTEFGNGQGGAVFTVNGVSQSTSPTTDTSFILNNNYVVYTNVVVSDATLAGTWYGPNNYGSLNGAQLQYFGPYVPLSIQNTNSQLKLQWSPGTLLEATNLLGPWVTNTAPSPYLVTPTGAQKFFRVKVQ